LQFFFFFSCCSWRVWCVHWRQTVVDTYIHTYIHWSRQSWFYYCSILLKDSATVVDTSFTKKKLLCFCY
jgi:hypothetical protein